MNKKVSFIFLLLLVLLGYVFKIDKIILIQFTNYTNTLKSNYKSYYKSASESIDKYFDQTKKIYELQEQLKNNTKYELLYKIAKSKLNIIENNNSLKINNFTAKYVEVLSYQNLNDFSKIILDINISKNNNIKALASKDGYSAGIVVNENNQVISYLNNNDKCNYAVFIGENLAPGITSGSNKQNKIILKHIPIWHKINTNDEVITSGMDNIFPIGLKLGRVSNITSDANTQTVFVTPYKDVLRKKYFYILDKNIK